MVYCQLPGTVKTKHNKVVIKFYDQACLLKNGITNAHLLSISLTLFQANVAPQILGVSDQGIIIEHIEVIYLKSS